MSTNTPLRILILISLITLSGCGKDPDMRYSPGENLPTDITAPTEEATLTPLPTTPTPTPWPFQPDSLVIRLDFYQEKQDGSLEFWVYVINPNPGEVTDCLVSVLLFDAENNQLIDNQETCGNLEAYGEEWIVVVFDESFVPDTYQAYNINALAAAPGNKVLEGVLNELPVSGQEGVEISQDRVLPGFKIELEWDPSLEEYLPGDELEVQMETQLVQGQLEESLLCLEVVEHREYNPGQDKMITLAESCQTVTWTSEGNQFSLHLRFQPSGYTWILKEDPTGEYRPLEISASAKVLLGEIPLAENTKELFLSPVKVEDASWSAEGSAVDTVQPETPYQVDLTLVSLANDQETHSVQLSVRYSEHDPEEWLFSSVLLFIPCLFGFCEDEAVVYTQEDQITLLEGAHFNYSIPILLPEEPTGESGVGGYYYLALAFDEITIWRGEKIPLE